MYTELWTVYDVPGKYPLERPLGKIPKVFAEPYILVELRYITASGG
jgi:hypothetical protein